MNEAKPNAGWNEAEPTSAGKNWNDTRAVKFENTYTVETIGETAWQLRRIATALEAIAAAIGKIELHESLLTKKTKRRK